MSLVLPAYPRMIAYPVSNDISAFHGRWLEPWPYVPRLPIDTTLGEMKHMYVLAHPMEMDMASQDFTFAIRRHFFLVPIISILYLAAIPFGQWLMRDRKPFKLTGLLTGWNMALCIFSFVGSVRMVPFVAYLVGKNGVGYMLCRNTLSLLHRGPPPLWMWLFVWSKFPELLDTVFLVLRKKNVNFLHWFHHVTVMGYCWYASGYEQPSGILFATMNYVVHTVMYFYYFLTSLGYRPRWGKLVTVLQIAQMIAGTCLTIYHGYLSHYVPNCYCHKKSHTLSFLMYGIYLYLFVTFFVSRYNIQSRKEKVV